MVYIRNMQTMTIPISDDILTAARMSKGEMAAAMSRDYAVKMFAEDRLTITQSASLCGINIFDFLDTLTKAGVPVADSEADDLEKESAYFKEPYSLSVTVRRSSQRIGNGA
jgi:predicted HTH domain antitoxin